MPDTQYSWEELDRFTAKKEGLWTWPTQAHINLLKLGFDVIDMDDLDNERFIKEGGSYLIEKYGEEVGRKQIERSDIEQERKLMKEYEHYNKHIRQLPSIALIAETLDKGFLAICNINAYVLNKKPGYAGHFVVIYGYDDTHLYLHDPGLPAKEGRKVTYEEFLKAWEYPHKNARNLTAFKL